VVRDVLSSIRLRGWTNWAWVAKCNSDICDFFVPVSSGFLLFSSAGIGFFGFSEVAFTVIYCQKVWIADGEMTVRCTVKVDGWEADFESFEF